MTDEELAALRHASTHALTHHRAPSADAIVRDLVANGIPTRVVGFEARIAAELGKPAAAYFPTGTMAQQIALRIWCDRARNTTVAFHPTSRLELYEQKAYAMLHGLRALHVGTSTRLITVADVRAIVDPLGAFLFELPQREIGALLPHWNDLVLMCDAARRTGAKLHLDGTRLWQAAPHYGRTHAEIAELFDSVYVSFNAGLDTVAGGMLVGDASFIAEARVWQHRHGGDLPTLPLLALAAEREFDRFIEHMPAYRERARELASAFATIDGVVPNAPAYQHVPYLLTWRKKAARDPGPRVRTRDRDVGVRAARVDRRAGNPKVGVRRRRGDDGAPPRRNRRCAAGRNGHAATRG